MNGLKAISRIINVVTKKRNKLSKKERDSLIKEKFETKYEIYYFLTITGFAIILFWTMFKGGMFLQELQKMLYLRQDMILFSPSTISFPLMFTFSLFLGFGLATTFVTIIEKLSPRLSRRIMQHTVKNFKLYTKSDFQNNLRFVIKYFIILIVIGIPIIFLALNSYSYVTLDGVANNGFFNQKEENLLFNQIEKVKIGFWIEGRRHPGIEYEYTLIFDSGEKINLKQANMADLSKFHDLLKSKDVLFEVSKFDENAMKWAEKNSPKELVLTMKNIFEIE